MQQTQIWTIKEITEVDAQSNTGKLKLEVPGHKNFTCILALYIPLDELRGYRVGDTFQVSVSPALNELTVKQ